MAKYWEDYEVGAKAVSPGRTVTEADISIALGIGRYTDPSMVDEEYAKTTIFKGRIAPGRFTIFIMGGLTRLCELIEPESVMALIEISSIRFRSPLRAGDTLRVELEITDKRETSKPDRGLIRHKESCKNQRDEVVVEMDLLHLFKRRPK